MNEQEIQKEYAKLIYLDIKKGKIDGFSNYIVGFTWGMMGLTRLSSLPASGLAHIVGGVYLFKAARQERSGGYHAVNENDFLIAGGAMALNGIQNLIIGYVNENPNLKLSGYFGCGYAFWALTQYFSARRHKNRVRSTLEKLAAEQDKLKKDEN